MQLKNKIKRKEKAGLGDVVVQTHCPKRKMAGLSSGP